MNISSDLLQFFIYHKIVRRKDAEDILAASEAMNRPLREYLLLKEISTEVTELESIADYHCLPCVEIDMLDIDKGLFNRFSFNIMKRNKFIPVSIDKNGTLLVAVGKPLDCYTLSSIALCYSGEVDWVLVPPTQIDRYIDSVAAVISTSRALDDLNSEQDKQLQVASTPGEDTMIARPEEVINNPSVRLVDSLIKEAVPYRASDIHIEPFEKKVKVRYRIDGDLQERAEIPVDAYATISARLKVMAGMDIAEHRIPQDGRINMVIGGKEYDFRVSTLPTVFGEKFVIRVLDKSSFHFTRADLGFTDEENLVIDKMLQVPHGIILLTGPTGCGKSTTLYSFLKEINTSTVNIVTVEDPVEYTMMGINQTQVNVKANMTFAAALRAIMRQDPDVIMIGEIRDEETAEIAVRASITGHMVFSTLHTNDAPGAVVRLSDMGVREYLLADAMAGVIAQRLVKRLCPACKKKGKTNAKEMEILGISEPVTIARPQGCQFCNNTGYKGRIAVHEIMFMTSELRDAVARQENLETLRRIAAQGGMTPLRSSCKNLVLKGQTSIQELMSINME